MRRTHTQILFLFFMKDLCVPVCEYVERFVLCDLFVLMSE